MNSGQLIDALNQADQDWNSNPDRNPTQNAVAWIQGMVDEVQQAQDMCTDLTDIIGRLGRTLGVDVEPHQTHTERLMDAAKGRLLTFARMSAINAERCLRWHEGGIEEWSISDWGVAFAGEAGEVCDAIKKLMRIRTGVENKSAIKTEDDAMAAIGTELADTILYADLLARRCGINLEHYIKHKFNEVSKKYGFPERL